MDVIILRCAYVLRRHHSIFLGFLFCRRMNMFGRSMFFCLLLEFWMRCTHACRNFGRWNLKGKVWSLSSRWSILPSPLILGPVSLCGQYLTNVRMHLQVNYVRPAPTVLRLDPMQITAKTETKISLYMKYLAPVSSVSQVSIKSSRAYAIPVITRVFVLRRPACCLFSV